MARRDGSFIKEGYRTAGRPAAPPAWDGILEEGGVLYMPRGWWHVACPVDEPSLHLTVGLSHPTGIRMLEWLVSQLKATVETRMDVPHLRTAPEQIAWIHALREHLLAAFDEHVVERLSHLRSRSVRELGAEIPPGLRPALALYLTAMAMGGALSVEPPAASRREPDVTTADRAAAALP
jgi:hypothetical protein